MTIVRGCNLPDVAPFFSLFFFFFLLFFLRSEEDNNNNSEYKYTNVFILILARVLYLLALVCWFEIPSFVSFRFV